MYGHVYMYVHVLCRYGVDEFDSFFEMHHVKISFTQVCIISAKLLLEVEVLL